MKGKYIFTKYNHSRDELELSYVIPECDPDYDIADILISYGYSDDGDSKSFEAEDLEDALYQANHWFGTCVTWKKISFSVEFAENAGETAYKLNDKKLWKRVKAPYFYIEAPYQPAPINIAVFDKKRMNKYYGKNSQKLPYEPYSTAFDYRKIGLLRRM